MTLSELATRGLVELRRAVKGRARAELRLPASARPVKADEVMIVVLSSRGAIAGTRKVPRLSVTPHDLRLWLTSAEAAIAELDAEPGAQSVQLSAGEASLLDEAGFTAGHDDEPGALIRSRIEFEVLLRRGSLTLADAAKALGVTASRLRQRLSPGKRTLYGIKDEGDWRIPKFQFQGRNRLVRGIDRVLPRIRRDAHPLSVKKWFTTPHQDLVLGQEDAAADALKQLTLEEASGLHALPEERCELLRRLHRSVNVRVGEQRLPDEKRSTTLAGRMDVDGYLRQEATLFEVRPPTQHGVPHDRVVSLKERESSLQPVNMILQLATCELVQIELALAGEEVSVAELQVCARMIKEWKLGARRQGVP